MATPLTDSINALTTYANEVTGASDTTLSDAVHTLASGYGSGGASSWTKVAETSYQVSTASISAEDVATWETGHSELWTSDKIVYVRIRDTAGKRAGYFYGSDNFFINNNPVNGVTSATFENGMRQCLFQKTDGTFGTYGASNAAGYGVFASIVYGNGSIKIRKRYNSSNSLNINGTYKVEVYLLDPPTGAPIFE